MERRDGDNEEKTVDLPSFVQYSGSVERVEQTTTGALHPLRLKNLLCPGGWLVVTGWWIAGLVLHCHDKNWIIPFLIWLCITLRVVTAYVQIPLIESITKRVWKHITDHTVSRISSKFRIPLAALLVTVTIVTSAFSIPESQTSSRADRAVSLFGFVTLISTLWATSRQKQMIKWRTVLVGLLVQFLVALFVLRSATGYNIFHFISALAGDLLGFANDGVTFLTDSKVSALGWFLIGVVPPIIFFIALIQILYHFEFIPWFIRRFAMFFWWSMGVSGAEAIAAAASPFIGQGENAVLIKPFIPYLTNAEIHQVMCSGFGTIAGSVLGAYISLGIDPQALISSCVMSIPASLAFSHLRYPEEEETITAGKVIVPPNEDTKTTNGLHALAEGAWLGLKVAGMVLANLLCIISILGLVNALLTWCGGYINLEGKFSLTIDLIVGYLCYPIAFLLGVPRNHELLLVGRLIGIKIVTNEFVAYTTLVSEPEYIALSRRSRVISTYALCGFGNLAALGTQIGVLSQIAPSRSRDVSKIAFSALLTGILSTLSSASIAGMLVEE